MLNAIHNIDTGVIREVADLAESIMSDERVTGTLAHQTFGLIGLERRFTGDAVQCLSLEGIEGRPGDFDKMCPPGELAQLLAWGRVLGVGYARIEYPKFRPIGEREVPVIRTWHPRYLRYEHPRNGLPNGRWLAMTSTGEVEVKPENGWILFLPYGHYRPWAFAPWRALGFAWIIKQLAILDRARFSEVSGQPVRVGIAPQGATERARKKWRAALQALSADSAMVLPEGYDFKLVEAVSRSYDVFQQSIDWSDKAITIALLGQTVTTEGSKGFSNGDNQVDVANALLRFLNKGICTTLDNQLITPWARLNFLGNGCSHIEYVVDPPDDEKERAEAIDTLGKAIVSLDAALAKSGYRTDSRKLATEFGVPMVSIPKDERPQPGKPPVVPRPGEENKPGVSAPGGSPAKDDQTPPPPPQQQQQPPQQQQQEVA